MQLRFASLVVINSRWDFHPQECAYAGRTKKKNGPSRGHPRIISVALMVTLLLDDHYLVAVTTMSTVVSAITVHLSPCAVTLLTAAAIDHDGFGARNRWRGDN